ncbi:MAG: hypothetical protein Q4G67_07360 [Actinomycetia bacterium]|nr:hypothetical protein [Actinomycetes bacterium]
MYANEQAGVLYEYRTTSVCGGVIDELDQNYYCEAAWQTCAHNTEEQGLGPAATIYRRAIGTTEWENRGTTCWPNIVAETPIVTLDMIINAFHDTAFAIPTIRSQPEGNTTLVTLPTYFEVRFPTTGYGPGQIDTTTLLGTTIEIRPRLDAITYHFGDGSTTGPTTDLGGPYPTGAITHAYARSGQYSSRADITYGGQFRVAGGTWMDIPGTANITGTPTAITVREARARLVNPP